MRIRRQVGLQKTARIYFNTLNVKFFDELLFQHCCKNCRGPVRSRTFQ